VIVILRDGVIEQSGTPLEVYDNPANLFVAEFIGSPGMNLLHGEISKTGFRTEGGALLPLPKSHKGKVGQKTIYGIRPEHLSPGKGVTAEVFVTEPTGPEIHIYADVAGNEVCAISRERIQPQRGSKIGLAPDTSRVHLFDAATGMAIR
jgi:multiple sugar transport system ATP-binding protein